MEVRWKLVLLTATLAIDLNLHFVCGGATCAIYRQLSEAAVATVVQW
jgi:hypothetical protein